MNSNNDCRNRRQAIAALALDELEPQAVNELRKHIDACQTCRSLYQALTDEEDTIRLAFDTITDRSKSSQDDLIGRLQGEPIKPSTRSALTLSTVLKSKVTKLTAAAVIVVSALIAISVFSGTRAWAQIVEALGRVENAHIDYSYTLRDGYVKRHQYWIRRPNYFRETLPNGDVVIDDGQDRLKIYTDKKEAQFSESWQPFHSLDQDAGFEMVNFVRDENLLERFKIEIARLSSESDERTVVYGIEEWDGQQPLEGKMWVDAETQLPLRIFLRMTVEIGDEPEYEGTLECKFNYDPMPDEFFLTTVPQGYTELPRIEPFTLSGMVVDEWGNGVEAATILAQYPDANEMLRGETDANGHFAIRPVSKKEKISLPIFLRAFRPDEPDLGAWTLLEDPESDRKQEFGGIVPGDPGQVIVANIDGFRVCNGSIGTVLHMRPAATISGIVSDVTRRPISGASISLISILSNKDGLEVRPLHLSLGSVKTDSRGEYVFSNLPQLWDKCRLRMTFRKEGRTAELKYITVEGRLEAEVVDLVWTDTDVTITGRAVDDNGNPLVGYRVLVRTKDRYYEYSVTDGEGYFALSNCPDIPDLEVTFKAVYKEEWEYDRNKHKITGEDELVYYPETQFAVDYAPGKKDYYVELVLEKPDVTLEVILKDTASEPIEYYAVGVQGRGISQEWRRDELTQMTDSDGRCVISGVPRVEDLKLHLDSTPSEEELDLLTEKERGIARTNKKYKSMRVPVELVPGKKEYRIEVTVPRADAPDTSNLEIHPTTRN